MILSGGPERQDSLTPQPILEGREARDPHRFRGPGGPGSTCPRVGPDRACRSLARCREDTEGGASLQDLVRGQCPVARKGLGEAVEGQDFEPLADPRAALLGRDRQLVYVLVNDLFGVVGERRRPTATW